MDLPLDAIKQIAEQLGQMQSDVVGKLGKEPFAGFSEQLAQYQSQLRALADEAAEFDGLKKQAAAASMAARSAAAAPPETLKPARTTPLTRATDKRLQASPAPSDGFSDEYTPGPETIEQLRSPAASTPAGTFVEPAIEETPVSVIAALMDFAKVTGNDAIYNVGCGDGRLLVAAASKHNAHGVGIDPRRDVADTARDNTRKARVQKQVAIHAGDPRSLDVAPASVVFLTLGASANAGLFPALLRQLAPGARIVTHQPSALGTPADEEAVVQDRQGRAYRLCLWRLSQRAASGPASSIGGLSDSDWE